MIKKEADILGNDMKKIFLGGFSQGSFVSLYTSHVLEEKIGGVIIIGAFMSKVVEKLPEKEELPPTLVIHSDNKRETKMKVTMNKSRCSIRIVNQEQENFLSQNLEKVRFP